MSVELTDEQNEYVNKTLDEGMETMRRLMEEVSNEPRNATATS